MKILIVSSILVTMALPAMGDLGIMDTASEAAAKGGASGLGVTQIFDHPGDVPNGSYVVPVEYNRTGAEGNGTEHDTNNAGKSDIDYIPLAQLKGANGLNGTAGVNGQVGAQGQQGVAGRQGAKGDTGAPGKDASEVTQVGVAVELDLKESPRYTIGLFGFYDAVHNQVAQGGVILRFRPFKTDLEKRIIRLENAARAGDISFAAGLDR